MKEKTAHYSQFYRQFCEKLTHDCFLNLNRHKLKQKNPNHQIEVCELR